MLPSVSWMMFITILAVATAIYYLCLLMLGHLKSLLSWLRKLFGLTAFLTVNAGLLRAQDGNAAISAADGMMRQYFQTGTTLMYSISAVIALIGAIRVYRVWNADEGHGQAYRAAAAWFGSCVFLVLVATVIRSFFGL